MKTFTNYAEKKAKQFLNLLQGYTKGIRITAILILLLMGVNSAWAYNYGGNGVYYYFANTGSWPGVHLYIWNGGWNTDFTLTQITNTKVYYHKWTSAYNNNEGILFRGAANWNNGQTSDIKANYTSHTSWVHNSTTGKTDLSNINRQAQVVVMLSTGGNYAQTANANCVAKVSGYTVVAGNSSATAKNASTSGSSATASISAAYGSTITYTATAGTGYTFKGFSTSNSTSLPASPSASGATATASGYGSTDNSTYYAYFKANSYTVKFDANGGTGGSMSNQSHTYGVSKALTANAFTRTGYTFAGWNTKADGTGTSYTDKQTVSNLSSTDGATITLYAQWTEKTYSLTFKHDGHGTIKVGGTTVNSGSTASVNHVTTKTLVATPNTGYNFSSWTLSGSNTSAVTIGSTSAASTTIKATNTGATVTANFTPKTYTITLDKNGGASNGSATATYNSSTITNLTHPTRTDYRCNGYYTATSGGTLVLNIDGTLAKNVSGYTDANGNWTKDGAATLYAQWTYDVTEYTVTFGVGTGSTSYGSLSAKNNSTSATITSPATVRSGQYITFTATPKTGYEVEGWYTDAACTSGKHDAGEISYTTSITGATNVYVKFVEKKWSVAFTAGTGGTVTTPSSTPQMVGEVQGITIIAETKEGYTFAGWTSSNGGKFDDARAEKTTFYPTAATTVTANFSENLFAIVVKSSDDNYGTVTKSADKAGIATFITITAEPKEGYRFVNWTTATAGITIANATDASTTVTATAAGTVTANFEEILTIVTLTAQPAEGGSFTVNGTSKASGSTVNVGVTTSYSVKAIANTGYTFDSWTRTSNVSAAGSGNAVTLKADGTGGTGTLYAKFKANTYTITYKDQGGSDFSGTHASGYPTTHTYGTATTLKDATKTGYTFDGWFTTSACTGTAITSLGATDYTSNITLYAKWTELPPTTVYFKPINDWKGDNIRFAVYYWEGNTNGWIDMIEEGCTGEFYKSDIPAGFTNIKFVSFPTDKENNWDYDINRTEDLKVPNDGKVLYDMASTNITQLYLQPNSNWKNDGARFAAYFFKQGDDSFGNKWISMSDSNSDGIYDCSIPTDKAYPNVIFCRMKGSNQTNNWGNKWNQTGDLTIPTDGKNMFDKPNDTWDGATTTWSTIYDDSKWSTWNGLTYKVELAGSMLVNNGNWVLQDMTVDANSTNSITVSLEANTTYEFKIVVNGAWHGNTGTMTYDNCTDWKMSTNTDNCKITTLIAGDYTFTYDVCTAKLSVAYPIVDTYDVTINADPAEAAAALTSSPQAVGILPVEISTTANAGYKFTEWTATDGITIKKATSSTTTITATQAGIVTAHFIAVQPTTVYFKPIDEWKGQDVRFAVYYWDESDNNGWVNMEDVGCTGEYFKAVVPGGYPNIKFVSFPTDKDNNWDYDINGTEDLTVPTDENVLFDMGTTSANKLYLKPNDKWENESNERYAAYFFGNGDKWVDMTSSTTLSGHYECNKQPDYPNIIFVRMDGANVTNEWSNKWTQTNDLTIPTNGDNIFTIADNAVTNQNADGYWSAGDNSQWTTFTEPTYSITLKANPHGTYTIAYAGETATSKTTEDVVIDKLPINTTITFTENAPQDGWALKDMSITANGETDNEVALSESYVMCSDVTITPQFVSAVPQVVYLKTSAWNSDSPKWVAHAFNNSDYEDIALTEITTCTDQPEFYQCTIPAGYHSLVFYRQKGDGSETWNQTADLTLPVKSDKNYYTFDNGGDNSKWSTNNHTYDVQVTASGGTITIIYNDTPTAVTNTTETITLPVNAEIKIEFSDAVSGYTPQDPTIKIGNNPVATTAGAYTICGPTTISTGFITERPQTVYLAPTYRWNADHAKFAVYAFNNKEGQWIEMKSTAEGSCDNTYFVCDIPAGMTAFSFVRLKPDGGLDWESKWNQTNDLTIPVDENNCYTITSMGENKSTGQWGVYTALTSFDVTLLPTTNGTITVEYNGSTTTSSAERDVVLNVEKDATIVLTFTPNENYKLASTSIIIGTNNEETAIAGQAYTICGATTIAAHFISTLNLQTIYLRPNEDWLKDDPIFAAYFYDSNNTDTYEWIEMKTEKTDYTGSYSCQVSQHFDHVVFVRIDPEGDQPFNNGINWENAWNQTKSLGITSDVLDQYGYRFAIGEKITQEGEDKDRYDGRWEQNTPIWSVKGQFNNWNGDAAVLRGYEGKAKLKLNANSSYQFKLYNYFGGNDEWQKYYGLSTNNQAVTINRTNYDTWRGMSTVDGSANNILETDHEGVYVFKLQYETTGSNNNKTLNKNLKVVFPTSAYRLAYMEEGKPETFRLSRYIEYIDEDTQLDTVSYFIDINKNFYIYVLEGLDITKLDTITKHMKNEFDTIKENNVYNFMLQQTNEPAQEPVHEATLLAKETHKYEGDYYIRTDGAEGGWNNYLQEGNKMTYFVYRPHQGEEYNHYWVASVRHSDDNKKVNVKARVANLYSDHLAIELAADKSTDEYGDVYINDPNGKIEKVNLRFGYNPSTNFFERAMLTGSGNNNEFLNITSGNTTIYLDSLQQKPLDYADKQSKFTDISNWVYEKDVWIPVATTADSITVKLSAKQYNDTTTHLFGYKEDGVTPAERVIIGKGTTPNSYKMRVIYDFKVNRIIMAWIPGTQNLTENINLNANILFIRHENDVVPQLNTNGKNIVGIQHQYFSMEFESKGKDNHEEHYWFSLPFDCVVGSITGVHGYMDIWGIQRYNGKKRAEIGWFAETATFWEWMTPNDTLKAGEGYVLSFAKELATWNTYDVFDDNENYLKTLSILRLYFPAIETGFDFQTKDRLVVTYPNEPCTIERDERYKQDGNWKIIGSTSYNNVCAAADIKTHEDSVWHPEGYEWEAPNFRYSYTYDNSSDHNRKTKWKYVPEDGKTATYNSFFGYMVQFAGTIKWEGFTQTIPSSVAARKNSSAEPTSYTTCLELVDNTGYEHDRTFVALDEEATIYNDLNKDLCKVFNSYCAQLYTTADDVNYAGNTLPMEKVTVPVGVVVKEVGEYTFRMPDGTDGISAILVDNQTGAHTNMLYDEYTVTLDAGTIENRFYLILDPKRTATSLEDVLGDGNEAKGDKAKGVEKFIIDGQLIIRTADGIYDAQGQRL